MNSSELNLPLSKQINLLTKKIVLLDVNCVKRLIRVKRNCKRIREFIIQMQKKNLYAIFVANNFFTKKPLESI